MSLVSQRFCVPRVSLIDEICLSGLVVQYEVKLQNGLECGGACGYSRSQTYLELLIATADMKLLQDSPEGIQAKELNDKTPFTIMFGPDRCGERLLISLLCLSHLSCATGATNKVHFIFRHKNPLTGVVEEKHLKSPPAPRYEKVSALYTLIVRPDNTYEIKINGDSKKKGSLLEDFDPPVNPPKEIDDASDTKPLDWVDESMITDPDGMPLTP